MRAKRLTALILPFVAILLGLGGFALASNTGQPHDTMTLLAYSITAAVLYIGSAVLFLAGLKNFTANLKRAYGIFCTGLILFALGEVQIPVFALLGQAGSQSWISGAGLLVPILVGVVCIYVGVRLFARLFNIKSIWGNPWFVAPAAIAGGIGAYLLPVGPAISTVEQAKGSNALMGIMFALFIATAVLCYHIQQKASVSYKKAMQWFVVTQLTLVAITIITIGAIGLYGTRHWFMEGGYSILVQAVFALAILKAAYEFNAINEAPEQEPGAVIPSSPVVGQPAHANLADIIIATAKKASDSTAIDPLLDGMRRVTSGALPGQPLSPADEVTLTRTYQRLEHYLTEEDPVRRYTKDELRSLIRKELRITGPSVLDRL